MSITHYSTALKWYMRTNYLKRFEVPGAHDKTRHEPDSLF